MRGDVDLHLKKLRCRDRVSADEEQAIRSAIGDIRRLKANEVAIRAGEELTFSTLLLDGWMGRAKDLTQGQRQITELHVAGDFADLHSFTLKRLEHDIITLTPCRVALVPHERLQTITERFPHLTRLYWMMTNIDAAIQREWTVSLGRRSALQRTAHLFCELRARLEVIDMVEQDAFAFPLTQAHMAECLGITPVHVNRTLQDLRRQGLIQLAERRVAIPDREKLERLAEFDPLYLYLRRDS